MKYPEIEVKLTGEDGNGFFIVGRTSQALRNGGVAREEVSDFIVQATSGDYDHLLQTVMEWVTVK